MAANKLNLTRDQLATFLKNFEQVKQFERLFQVADEIAPATDTVGISIAADSAFAAANEALALVGALGTMATQNADNVAITGGSISGLGSPLTVDSGGTGQSTFVDGQLLIGNTAGNTLTKAALTPGANIAITNGAGSIAIAVSGLGTMAFENTGATGSFTTVDLKTVTVVDGVITSIV